MNAVIITIGDELLIGQVVNTNQAYISQELNGVGIFVDEQITIGDDFDKIISTLKNATEKFDVIILTGGLGPTHDDITRNALCKFFNCNLKLDEQVLENIKLLLTQKNLELTDVRQNQAMIPSKSISLENKLGTAPGMLFEFQQNKFLISLPGVPYEMKYIFKNSVAPFLKSKFTGNVILHKTLKTSGISESNLSQKIGDVKNILRDFENTSLAFLPNPMGTKLRITVKNSSREKANQILNQMEIIIRSKVEKYIYSSSEDELENVILDLMTQNNFTLSVAESCTGGLIANRLTNISNSSKYFLQGIVAYSNQSKINLLQIDKSILEEFGAVSQEVAEAMAIQSKNISGSTHSLSVTGIAGPTGATIDKPIGLVWIGYSDKNETIAYQFNFPSERIIFKEVVSQQALEILRRKILKIPF